MFSQPIQRLTEFFLKFPGVGPKQAARFVFHLLREDGAAVRELAEAIAKIQDEVRLCGQCYKTFDANGSTPQSHSGQASSPRVSSGASPVGSASGSATLCELCRNPKRNARQVLVVEKEADLENIERSHWYEGLYHVLGGIINPLDSSAPARLHLKELFSRMQGMAQQPGDLELVLGTNPTTEGDATALYLERVFAPLKNGHASFRISRLGRGLTTGSELEYSDEMTITSALQNRK